MFRWYKNATVCYAYLSDVSKSEDPTATAEALRQSVWFTRGWTLQELLAPATLVFYSSDWQPIGTKIHHRALISQLTGIDEAYLMGADLRQAPISKRMSWAALRKTSRTEDRAYCLLGIFDVNMALIYGEGTKAFGRLQRKIMKEYPFDHTLFAWGKLEEIPRVFDGQDIRWRDESTPWDGDEAQKTYLGLFAPSPEEFQGSGLFVPAGITQYAYRSGGGAASADGRLDFPVTRGDGVLLDLPILRSTFSIYHMPDYRITQFREVILAVILCQPNQSSNFHICVPFQRHSSSSFARWGGLFQLDLAKYHRHHNILNWSKKVYVAPQRHVKLAPGDILFRRLAIRNEGGSQFFEWGVGGNYNQWLQGDGLCRIGAADHGALFSIRSGRALVRNHDLCCSLVLGRLQPQGASPLGHLAIDLFATCRCDQEGPVNIGGVTWHHGQSIWFPKQRSLYTYVMKQPVDSWSVNDGLFPRIYVEVERVPLRGIGSYIDVVDIKIDQGMGLVTSLDRGPSLLGEAHNGALPPSQ